MVRRDANVISLRFCMTIVIRKKNMKDQCGDNDDKRLLVSFGI